MSFSADSPPAGWYPDPAGSGGERFWDGGSWSQVTRPAGGMSSEPSQQQYVSSGPGSPYGHGAPYGQGTPYGQGAPHGAMGYGPQMPRQPVLAGFWWRVLAHLLDSFITAIPIVAVVYFMAPGPVGEVQQFWNDSFEAGLNGSAMPAAPESALFVIQLVMSAMWFIYRTVMVALKGGTVGKLILGMRVLRVDSPPDTNPSWGVSTIRAVGGGVFERIPFLALIDPLVMLFTPKKQTLHDMLARTVVIKK